MFHRGSSQPEIISAFDSHAVAAIPRHGGTSGERCKVIVNLGLVHDALEQMHKEIPERSQLP